jgi:hypothetical protein
MGEEVLPEPVAGSLSTQVGMSGGSWSWGGDDAVAEMHGEAERKEEIL